MAGPNGAILHHLTEQVRGDTVALRFSVCTPDGGAKDLTGAAIKWALKTSDKITQVLDDTSAGVGVSVEFPATAGIVTVTMAPTVTVDLTDSVYYDELEVTDGNGSVRTGAYGWIPFRDSQV